MSIDDHGNRCADRRDQEFDWSICAIFPASHYVVPQEKINQATVEIEKEMEERVRYFKGEDKLIE